MTTAPTPILLFGESYHHPNIFYRTGFLAPDPVVVVDRGGDDTVLWTSRLEEGRARKEARGGRAGGAPPRSWTGPRRWPGPGPSRTPGQCWWRASAAPRAWAGCSSTPTSRRSSPTT